MRGGGYLGFEWHPRRHRARGPRGLLDGVRQMRRDIRDELIAWTIGLLSIAAAAALLTGCASAYPTEPDEEFSAVEMALVDNTARWAAQLGVNVRGEITSRMHPGLTSLNPAGGYAAGGGYHTP